MDLWQWLLAGIALAFAYITPTWIAFERAHPNAIPIAIVNLLLGWTLLGWAVALAWSASAIRR